jgi:hypothetical protein
LETIRDHVVGVVAEAHRHVEAGFRRGDAVGLQRREIEDLVVDRLSGARLHVERGIGGEARLEVELAGALGVDPAGIDEFVEHQFRRLHHADLAVADVELVGRGVEKHSAFEFDRVEQLHLAGGRAVAGAKIGALGAVEQREL